MNGSKAHPGHGKIKPALIITNDFELKAEEIIRKYSRRWLIEKSISEQIIFFSSQLCIIFHGH